MAGSDGIVVPADTTFGGWKTEADGPIYNAGDTFTMPASNVTLHARWMR